MSAFDPKLLLKELKEQHKKVAEDMETLRVNLDKLQGTYELAESIEEELWGMIKDLEKELKDDEEYLKLYGVKCNFTKD